MYTRLESKEGKGLGSGRVSKELKKLQWTQSLKKRWWYNLTINNNNKITEASEHAFLNDEGESIGQDIPVMAAVSTASSTTPLNYRKDLLNKV